VILNALVDLVGSTGVQVRTEAAALDLKAASN
jgi:hypothetical protein